MKSVLRFFLGSGLLLFLSYSQAVLEVHNTPLHTVGEQMIQAMIGLLLLALPAASYELVAPGKVSRPLLKLGACYLLLVACGTAHMEWSRVNDEGYQRLVGGFSMWLTLTSPCAFVAGLLFGWFAEVNPKWLIAYVIISVAAAPFARLGYPIMFFTQGCLLSWLPRVSFDKAAGKNPQL